MNSVIIKNETKTIKINQLQNSPFKKATMIKLHKLEIKKHKVGFFEI